MTADELAAIVRGIVPVIKARTEEREAKLHARIAALEAQLPRDGRDGQPGRDGAPGPPGAVGRDGSDGKDGRDGTLEQLKIVRHSERVIEFCGKDGTPIEGGRITLNHPVFQDTWVKQAEYDEADVVQYGGGGWIAVKAHPPGTPGQGSPDVTGWKLFIKPGRDGKDAK